MPRNVCTLTALTEVGRALRAGEVLVLRRTGGLIEAVKGERAAGQLDSECARLADHGTADQVRVLEDAAGTSQDAIRVELIA